MIEFIKSIDLTLLDLINGAGRPFLDPIMIFLSAKFVWIPLYLYLIFLLYAQYGKRFWIPLLFIVISLTLSDQFTSSFMKPYFQRLRPCLDQSLAIVVEIVKGCGGKYGFASSHAANTMGLAVFYLMLLKTKKKILAYAIFTWALMVGYSRAYLGVHYPGDVIVGFLVGGFFGYLCYQLHSLVIKKLGNSLT
ncbi:MAG: phosphatase PAP2 family protein [Cyclobacteriaceae bacterium]|jgi:undecaprenyl-diphosphatase|nr:phosphatase PAP2 family protein [Flammeovirgaceae bacterium]MDG1105923.1 phosphatase PAP2 family protein [Cyclobacteriaceae bacterium]